MLELFKIYKAENLQLSRYGNLYDGGYVIAKGLTYDYFLSCGIGGNITFELDFIKNNPLVGKSFFDSDLRNDESTKEKLRLIPNLHFYWLKINGSNGINTTNLHEYLSKFKNIFIKMDIEGGEFSWIESLPLELQKNIKQMVIEFHDVQRSLDCIRKLQLTHSIIHMHGNNYSPMVTVDNHGFPSVYEITLLRNDYDFKQSKIQSELDSPNNPYKPEINLNYL